MAEALKTRIQSGYSYNRNNVAANTTNNVLYNDEQDNNSVNGYCGAGGSIAMRMKRNKEALLRLNNINNPI